MIQTNQMEIAFDFEAIARNFIIFEAKQDQGDYWKWVGVGDNYGWLRTGGKPASGDPKDGKGALWGLSWYGIRKANIGLANLDKLTQATTEERNLIEGQLYFFRGWFHFMLMQFWGGLPYVDEVLPSDEVLKRARLTYRETADKASEDFRKAAALLPLDWDAKADIQHHIDPPVSERVFPVRCC